MLISFARKQILTPASLAVGSRNAQKIDRAANRGLPTGGERNPEMNNKAGMCFGINRYEKLALPIPVLTKAEIGDSKREIRKAKFEARGWKIQNHKSKIQNLRTAFGCDGAQKTGRARNCSQRSAGERNPEMNNKAGMCFGINRYEKISLPIPVLLKAEIGYSKREIGNWKWELEIRKLKFGVKD